MRILQIGPIPQEVGGKTQGGVATHLWALSGQLVKQGHAVAVLGDNYYEGGASPVTKQGIRLFGLRGLGRSVRTAYLFCPALWLKWIRVKAHFGPLMGWKAVLAGLLNYHRVIQAFKPEIIHVHHLETRFPFVSYLVEDRIPVLTTVHSTSFIEFSPASLAGERRDFIRRNLNLARHLIFVSRFLAKRFAALFPGGWEEKSISVVHNPVDGSVYYPISKAEARAALGLKPAGSVILFVGNLIPQKGVEILIEAARLLQSRGTPFKALVVGSGSQGAELEGLVQGYGLSDQVHFEGSKSQSELFLYYNAADLLVLPSVMESFGLVLVEAMLCGCPVIGRAEVTAEILPSESCGYYLPSDNPERWADLIAEALARAWSKDEIRDLSRAYTWEVIGDRFEKVYQRILA